MICPACSRSNLPGGLRCAYCGAYLAAPTGGAEAAAAAARVREAKLAAAAVPAPKAGLGAGAIGSILLLILKGKWILTLLKSGKLFVTLFSMLAFIGADAVFFGWKLGVGIALSILIHELGHVVVNARHGLRQSAPTFIPFLGAMIFVKGFPDDPTVESECGAGGPIAGGLAALVCLGIASATHSLFWYSLATIGFAINLFNLIPFSPLDGSRIATVFSPAIWGGILVAILLWVVKVPSPMLWLILIVGVLARLSHDDNGRHLLAMPAARFRMAAVYLALAIVLAGGAQYSAAERMQLKAAEANSIPSIAVSQDSRPIQAPTPAEKMRLRRQRERIEAEAGFIERYRVIILLAVKGVVFSTVLLLWLASTRLIASTAQNKTWKPTLLLTSSMALITLLTLIGMEFPIVSQHEVGSLYLALPAMAFAGFCYSVFCYFRRSLFSTATITSLTLRCLAWAAAGAMLVAYARNSLAVTTAVALCAVVFYTVQPGLLYSLIGKMWESLGDLDKGIQWRKQALKSRISPDAASLLWNEIANASLRLNRGTDCIAALAERDALGHHRPAPLHDFNIRAQALGLVGNYDEALHSLESLLQIAAGSHYAAMAEQLAYFELLRLASMRGWLDEELALVDLLLGKVPATSRGFLSFLEIARGEVFVSTGHPDLARTAHETAIKINRDTSTRSSVALLRARLALLETKHDEADTESAHMLSLSPADSKMIYWRGRILHEIGRIEEGDRLLRDLIERAP